MRLYKAITRHTPSFPDLPAAKGAREIDRKKIPCTKREIMTKRKRYISYWFVYKSTQKITYIYIYICIW